MKLLLKAVAILIVFSILGGALYLYLERDVIKQTLHKNIVAILSEKLQKPVSIEGITIEKTGTVTLEKITVFKEKERFNRYATIKELSIHPDFLSLFKRLRLEVSVDITDLAVTSFIKNASGTVHLSSPKITDIRKLINRSFIENAAVNAKGISVKGIGMAGDDKGESLIAMFSLDGRLLKKADIRFSSPEGNSRIILKNLSGTKDNYIVDLSHRGLLLTGGITWAGKDLFLTNIDGYFLGVPISLKANIKNFKDPPKAIMLVDVDVECPLEDIARDMRDLHLLRSFPGFVQHFEILLTEFRNALSSNKVQGNLKSTINLSFQGLRSRNFFATSKFSVEDLRIRDIPLGPFSGIAQFDTAELYLRNVYMYPFGGKGKAEMSIKTNNPQLPYKLEFELTQANLASLLNVQGMKNYKVNGNVYFALSLDGKLLRPLDSSGKCWITVRANNLSSLPMIKGMQDRLISQSGAFPLSRKDLEISKVSGEFEIKNYRMVTDTLEIEGNHLSLDGRGFVSINGDLFFDFTSYIDLPGTIPKSIPKGTIPSKASLRGNIRYPKWVIK